MLGAWLARNVFGAVRIRLMAPQVPEGSRKNVQAKSLRIPDGPSQPSCSRMEAQNESLEDRPSGRT
jgi:hypothetical protein